ncbi:MAG TPA: hypothetical protein VJW75_00645 [Candidatus Eisenbacteria bacterium]|nr:hypothetical protein [Candidatus Eisenbacteria bacterium]
MSQYVALRDGRIVQAGTEWLGAAFPVELFEQDCATFIDDARFRHLGRVIASRRRSPFDRQLLTALRAYDTAILPQPDQVRVVLLATAMEAILGDDKSFDRAHRIARRSAYVTCVPPGDISHANGRPTCLYMRAPSTETVEVLQRMRADESLAWDCTAYTTVRSLFRHRNNAVHRGATNFDERAMRQHRWAVREALLATIEWAIAHRGEGLKDIDAGIASLPAN